jgi:amino acid permease
MQEAKRLTFFEATAIITGYGVGGGIMAVPYLASLSGMAVMVAVLAIAYAISLLMHLMIAEVMLRDNESGQLIELFEKYLFRGRLIWLMWIFFSLVVLAFVASLSAYIAGGGEILADLLPISPWVGATITYAIAAGVVFFGLKALGMSEKFAVIGIMALIGVFAAAAARHPFSLHFAATGHYPAGLALFGMVMFSFFAIFSVPQAAQGLSWHRPLLPRAIATGIGINALIILTLTATCIGVPGDVTRVAIIGLGQALGGWTALVGSAFILLAMLTSYWSVSFALSVVVQERLGWGPRLSWLAATLPTFLIVISGALDFLGFMRLAGGAIAVLIAVMVVPLVNGARKHGRVSDPEWVLGVWGRWPFQALVILGFLLMAAGSMVSL